MNRFFISDGVTEDTVTITGQDVNHIRNVLRLKSNDEIMVCDQKGRDYLCVICEMDHDRVIARVTDVYDNAAELPVAVTLFQGYPKSDKMDTIIQKTVELGVSRIVPVITKRTIARPDDKKAAKKTERYNAIALSAAKQSGRGMIPEVTAPVSFKEALRMAGELDMNIIPYEEAQGMAYSRQVISEIADRKSLGIFIGPEGGFTSDEVDAAAEAGASVITLGHRILRTETAGMTIMSIIMFELEK